MDKKTIMAGILIAAAIYATAEGVITTQEGDLKLNPARDLTATVPGGDVFINGAWIRTRDKLGYSAAGGSSFISDLLYWHHDGTNGVIATSNGDLNLKPANDLTFNAPGGDLFVENAWVRTRNKLGYSAAGGSSFITDLLYWHHNGADGVITTSSGKIILDPAGDAGKIRSGETDLAVAFEGVGGRNGDYVPVAFVGACMYASMQNAHGNWAQAITANVGGGNCSASCATTAGKSCLKPFIIDTGTSGYGRFRYNDGGCAAKGSTHCCCE